MLGKLQIWSNQLYQEDDIEQVNEPIIKIRIDVDENNQGSDVRMKLKVKLLHWLGIIVDREYRRKWIKWTFRW